MRQHPRDILGVDKHTSSIEIRKRYHALMRQYHPDKLVRITDEAARKKAEQKGMLIQWAYELINNPTKLKAFEDLHASQSHFDPAFAIEYLRYDADGNAIGSVPRHSDRYRKLYDEYLEEFQISTPNHSPAPNQLIEQLNSNDEKDIYQLIKDKEAQDSSDTHAESKSLEINSNYLSILNGIQHFFQLGFDKKTLDKLRTDIQKVLEGELDTQVRELTLAFSTIINADSIQANVHYPALNQLYNFMYRSIDSANEQVINIIANTQFQNFVKQVQKHYLGLQQPKHLTKEWLSTFDSEKPKHLLESNLKTQTYSHIEKEYADSFKDNHESTASEKIIEAACKQVDIAEVKFEKITPDNNIDEDDDITENTNPTRNHQPRIKPILPKPKIKRSGTSARIGKANHYLLSAIAFQTNARFESEPAKIAAGESVALNLYRSSFMEVRKASSITRLYIFYQILSGVLSFKYQGDGVEKFIKTVYSEFDLVSQFMPFVSMPLSHNDLHKLTEMDEKWLYNVLDHVSLSTQFDIQERTRAAYLLFEGVYTGLFPADKFDELRLRSMDTYLQSKGLSLAHMTEHLHPANSVLKRSPKGFVDPTAELNIPDIDGGRIIADIHGFKIDAKTGELSFQLTYWDENMPRSLRLMTESEFYHMLQYKIDHLDKAWFTLDPPDALFQHLPLQEAISSLPDIPLRQTLLDVDYAALKFFTTTGVSGVHPFDHEDTVEMIAHLPTHLIEVLMTKQSNAAGYFYNSTDPSRYWYKVGAVERYYNNENGEILCQIGKTPLIMSHQKMVIDQSGNMVDDHQPDELDLIINRALQNPQQVNELISHAVDPQEKSVLQDLASDLTEADILFKESRKELMILKATINQDDTIEKADKEKAFASQSTRIINRIHYNSNELADIRLRLQQQLKAALDLNKVFAKRFTEHMDELAQHIPIINRLRLFIKLNVIKNTFNQVRTEHAGNSLILKQLDILQVNQVEVAKEDSDKKVYVPAAIKRDIEGGLISFGGVSCEYLLTMLEQRIDSKIAQHDVLKTLNNRFSFGQPTANDIKNAQYQLGLSSYKMSTEDYIQAQSQISSAQLTLDLNKSHSSWMEEISNLHQFKPSLDPISTLCSDSIQTSSFDFFPKNNFFPLDPLASNFPPAPNLFAQESSLSATASEASAAPTPVQSLLQAAPPAFHPAPQPAAPQPAAPQPDPPPSFFFPPYFETDPYARKRPDVFINNVNRWQAAMPAYFAAGKTLSELSPPDAQDRFEELREQASYLVDESQRVIAPIVNKFINAVEQTLEPISSFMIELPLKDFAATVIGASHMPESHPSLATPDHQLTKELIRQCPAIYDFSQEQLKKYDANTATIVAPGVFSVTAEAFRGGFSVLSQASTLNALGIPPCPPEHHPKSDKENTINLSSLLHTIQNPEDLKILPVNLQDQLTYVINEKGELTLHPCLSHSDKPFCTPNTDIFYLNPVDQQISRITAMGTIELSESKNGPTISMIQIAEAFANVPEIKATINNAFEAHSFGDVSTLYFIPLVSQGIFGYPLHAPNDVDEVDLNTFKSKALNSISSFFKADENRFRISGRLGSSEFYQSTTLRLIQNNFSEDSILDEIGKMFISIPQGAINAFVALAHPIDNFLKPTGRLIFDTGILLHPSIPNTDPFAVIPDFGLGLSPEQLLTLQESHANAWEAHYNAALERMQIRGESTVIEALNFMTGTASEQAEIATTVITGYALGKVSINGIAFTIRYPGMKLGQIRARNELLEIRNILQQSNKLHQKIITATTEIRSANLELFGIPQKPTLYPNLVTSNILKYPALPPSEVMTNANSLLRLGEGEHLLNYAVDQRGRAFFSRRLVESADFLDISGKPYLKIYNHSQLLGGEAGIAFGEAKILIENSKVQVIFFNNHSGHYCPGNIGKIAEHAINKRQLNASGKYQHNNFELSSTAVKNENFLDISEISRDFSPYKDRRLTLPDELMMRTIERQGKIKSMVPISSPIKIIHSIAPALLPISAQTTDEQSRDSIVEIKKHTIKDEKHYLRNATLATFGPIGIDIAWREFNNLPHNHAANIDPYCELYTHLQALKPYAHLISDKMQQMGELVFRGLKKMQIHKHSMFTLQYLQDSASKHHSISPLKSESPLNQLSLLAGPTEAQRAQQKINHLKMDLTLAFIYAELDAAYRGVKDTYHLATNLWDEAVVPTVLLAWDSIIITIANIQPIQFKYVSAEEQIALYELHTIMLQDISLYQDSLKRMNERVNTVVGGSKVFWEAKGTDKLIIGTEIGVSVVLTHKLFHSIKIALPLLLRSKPLKSLNSTIFSKTGQILADFEIGSIIVSEQLVKLADAAKKVSNQVGNIVKKGIPSFEKTHEIDHIIHSIHEIENHQNEDHNDMRLNHNP